MKLKNLTILNSFVVLLLISCGSGDDSTDPIEVDDEQLNDTLVWTDEFNDNGSPNSSKWTYDIGNNGWGNNEYNYIFKIPLQVQLDRYVN